MMAFEGEELLDFRFTFDNLPIWAFMRWEFFLQAMVDGLGLQSIAAPRSRLTLFQKCDYAAKAWENRPTKNLRPFDILWFGSSAGVVIRKGEKWFGRVNDYQIDLHPDGTLLIEDSFQHQFKIPRTVKNLRFHDFIRIKAIASPKRVNPLDKRRIVGILDYLREKFFIRHQASFYQGLEARLLNLAGCLPIYHAEYNRLFDLTQPKLLLQEDGSYGMRSFILAWARKAGIRTAEMQHGAIMPTHHAYNYGRAGFHSDYRRCLPEFLLTYGKFWSECTRTPSVKVEIGNPHFSSRMEEAVPASPYSGKRLLIVSQADVTDHLVELARALARLDPAMTIIYRLHPAEVVFEDRYSVLKDIPNVELSRSGDIYELIRNAKWVIGAASTVLYESIGLGKPVYVLNCPSSRLYTAMQFGTWFEDAKDFLVKVGAGQKQPEISKEDVWAPGWQENYLTFMRNDIGLSIPNA
jgi:hypothetical protein